MNYAVIIDGTTLNGFDAGAVRTQFAKLIGATEDDVARLLNGKTRTIKSNLDQPTGMRYVEALRRIGVSCELKQELLSVDLNEAVSPRKEGDKSLSSTMREDRPAKAADEKYCSECGAIIKSKAEICPKCGVRQLPPPNQLVSSLTKVAPNGKSKLVAALFAIFLGTFGLHKFYLGKVGQGILYLLFCWTGIPTLLGFIEGILYLVTSEADFERRYGVA